MCSRHITLRLYIYIYKRNCYFTAILMMLVRFFFFFFFFYDLYSMTTSQLKIINLAQPYLQCVEAYFIIQYLKLYLFTLLKEKLLIFSNYISYYQN